jgi:hypothetical protein
MTLLSAARFVWMDEPWLERVHEQAMEGTKDHQAQCSKGKPSTARRLETDDASTFARVALWEEVSRTKCLAQHVVALYVLKLHAIGLDRLPGGCCHHEVQLMGASRNRGTVVYFVDG